MFFTFGYKIHMYDGTHDEHNIIHDDVMMHQYIVVSIDCKIKWKITIATYNIYC
jgi:hypothetical protein